MKSSVLGAAGTGTVTGTKVPVKVRVGELVPLAALAP
jgi:hypothetical protein